jgi:hypothetical protein
MRDDGSVCVVGQGKQHAHSAGWPLGPRELHCPGTLPVHTHTHTHTVALTDAQRGTSTTTTIQAHIHTRTRTQRQAYAHSGTHALTTHTGSGDGDRANGEPPSAAVVTASASQLVHPSAPPDPDHLHHSPVALSLSQRCTAAPPLLPLHALFILLAPAYAYT